MDTRPRPPRPAPRPSLTEKKEPEKKDAPSAPATKPSAGAPTAAPSVAKRGSEAVDQQDGRWAKQTVSASHEVMAPLIEQSEPSTKSPPELAEGWAKQTVGVPHAAMAPLIEQSAPSRPPPPEVAENWAKQTVEVSLDAMAPLVEESVPSTPSAPELDERWAKKTMDLSHESMAPLLEQTRSATAEGEAPGAAGASGVDLAAGSVSPALSATPSASRRVIPVMVVSFVAVFAIGGGLYMLRKGGPSSVTASGPRAPAESAAASETERVVPPTPTAAPSPAAPAPSAAPAGVESAAPKSPSAAAGAQDGVESEARAALSRLRDGIVTCARHGIGYLPGTSPAIPASLATLKAGAYASAPREWSTPVWSCAKFRQAAPQRFQIQWQMTKPGVEGMGVAWLDDDADGKPDRAFGFQATLKQKARPEVGEVKPIDASRPVTPSFSSRTVLFK